MTQMATISIDSTIVAVRDQVSSPVNEEAVILQLQRGTYYGVNDVGAVIWNLVQQPRRVGEIERELMAQFDVGAEQCRSDLFLFLEALAEAELIEVRDVAGA